MKVKASQYFRRGMSLLLTLALLLTSFPSYALAYIADKPDKITVVSGDGTETEIDESWVATYPHGLFAFENREATVWKGESSQTINVYRLGGTQGRAHVNIMYTPAYTQVSEDEMSYVTAAGKNDIVFEVENALPYAKYQPLGAEGEPWQPDIPVTLLISESEEGGEYTISPEGIAADSYIWYVWFEGQWHLVEDATSDALVIAAEHGLDQGYDYMCVFTIDGVRYGSDSAAGERYLRHSDDLGEGIDPLLLAEMVAEEHEQTFSVLPMEDEDEYASYIFEMIFAEDEWVKEIKITAPDNGMAKPDTFGVLRMVGYEGGGIFQEASTVVIQISDDNYQRRETQIGFAVEAIRVDKATGNAYLTVAREGDLNYPVSLEWHTQDLTAQAGIDYAASNGTLMFYADVKSAELTIPLIDDGQVSVEDRRFAVVLENLLGGGENESANFSRDTVYVDLYNSATATVKNLPTVLHDAALIDLSESVAVQEEALVATPQPLTGTLVETSEPTSAIPAKVVFPNQGSGGFTPASFTSGAKLNFSGLRDNLNYASIYWDNVLDQVTSESGTLKLPNSNGIGRYSWNMHNCSFDNFVRDGRTHYGISNNQQSWAYLNIEGLTKMFSSASYRVWLHHRMRYSDDSKYGKNFILEPSFVISGANIDVSMENGDGKRIPIGGSGEMNDFWNMYYKQEGTGNFDFSKTSSGISLNLMVMIMKGHAGPKSGFNWQTNDRADAGLDYLYLTRRAFGKDLGLRIYTANDANASYEDDTDMSTLTLFDASDKLYEALNPRVTIQPGNGGINTDNKLFVGSTLQISTDPLPTYQMLFNDTTQYVFLSQKTVEGEKIVASGMVEANNPNSATLRLLLDGITLDDVNNGDFTLNIVLERKQDVVMELLPSVPRLDDGINIDPDKIGDAYKMLRESNKNAEKDEARGITITYSVPKSKNIPVSSGQEMVTYELMTQTVSLPGFEIVEGAGGAGDQTAFSLATVKNLQSINFNLDPEDLIIYSGSNYKGNQTIPIQKEHMSNSLMTFRYYNKDYLTALSVMVPVISDIALYLDVNGDGKIGGYFNTELNTFVANTEEDEIIGYLTLEAYEETIFAPVLRGDKYLNHFVSVEYTITPRCLVLPSGGSESDRAQVLPALTTSANNVNTLTKVTREQKGYRYVSSGPLALGQDKDSVTEKAYSSDGILMYGAEASAPNLVNFSAGGDQSPARREDPEDFTSNYKWEPDFHGNLLFPFENPEPVAIEESLAGKNILIAEFLLGASGAEDGKYQYETTELDRINGYLGSLSGMDTFALTVWKQPYDEDKQLIPQNELPVVPLPEVSRSGGISLFPNADYLLAMKTADNPEKGGMSSGGGDFDEFGLDMGIELPSIEIGLSDYVTIVLDGYDIGFAIGIPLAASERKTTGSTIDRETQNPKTANAENVEKFQQFFTGAWGQLTKDEAYQKAKSEAGRASGNPNPNINKGEMSSSSAKVSLDLRLGFMFTYNPLDNGYYFSKFAISIAAAFEYKYTYRLTFCPIVYVYVKVGVGLELSTGLQVVREVVENDKSVEWAEVLNEPDSHGFKEDAIGITGKLDDYIQLKATHKAYNIYFTGKLLIQMPDPDEPGGWITFGYIASNDRQKAVTVILKQQDGYVLPEDEKIDVRFVALENVTIRKLVSIKDADSYTYWSGMAISPSAVFEVGAGLGVDMLKVELFAQVAVEASMTLGTFNLETKTHAPFSFDEFEMRLGIGLRVVLLFFSIEKEAIQYILNYEKGRGGSGQAPWMHGYSALGGAFGKMNPISGSQASSPYSMAIYGAESEGNHLKLPQSVADRQRVKTYSDSLIQPAAFDTTSAPFQLSGYGSSGDAFMLMDRLVTGYDYQVVTIGETNYLLYHLGRDAVDPRDSSMLVLSEIVLTGTGVNEYGLRHPVNKGTNPHYIAVDVGSETGDLDFDAWVEGDDTLKTAWISYAEQAPRLEATLKVVEGGEGKVLVSATPSSSSVSRYVYRIDAAEVSGVRVGEKVSGAQEFDQPSEYEVESGEYFTLYGLDASDRVVSYVSHQCNSPSGDGEGGIESLPIVQVNQLAGRTNIELLAESASNTVVKTAYWTLGKPSFTPAEIIGEVTDQTVFSPRISGDAVLHVTSEPYTEAELDEAAGRYVYYLKLVYGADTGNISFLTDYYRSMKTVFGKENSITVSVYTDEGKWISGSTKLSATDEVYRTVENIELTEIDGKYYVAYTTSEEDYLENELVYTKRLILRAVDVEAGGSDGAGQIKFGDPYLLRTLVNYDNPSLNSKDGIYKNSKLPDNSELTEEVKYEDPYFAELKFLNAKLGELDGEEEDFEIFSFNLMNDPDSIESFLLFEMNGNTYVIPEKDLQNITGNGDSVEAGKGRIIPFFTLETYQSLGDEGATEQGKAAASGYTGLTIGADNEGNISAVYVGTVPNTGHNAIYISQYYSFKNEDEQTVAGWKPAQILAMRDMQVYEDSITYGWTDEETRQAYLEGIKEDILSDVAQFKFSNLQFAIAKSADSGTGDGLDPEIYSASLEVDDAPLVEGVSRSYAFAPQLLAAATSEATSKGTTLILTEGVLTPLYEKTYENDSTGEEEKVVVPSTESSVGFYAIAFGQGEQALGNISLSIGNSQLVKDSSVKADIAFTNTGNTRIRASVANPVEVTLRLACKIDSSGQVVGTWQVVESIDPGQEVFLSDMVTMPRDVKAGDYFYFTVAEDVKYIDDNPFKATSCLPVNESDANYPIGRYIVKDLPDLGFEQVSIRSVGVDSNGRTILDADFYVTNRGTAKAEDVFAQFKVQTGVDGHGNPKYKPLDLTDSIFEIGGQKELEDQLSTLMLDLSLQNGVLKMENSSQAGDDDLEPGKGRHVEGTFYVSSSDYMKNATNNEEELVLEMELFSGGDDIEYQVVGDRIISQASGHNELASLNNSYRAVFNHQTYYSSASNIAIPLGTPLLLPFSLKTTYIEKPDLVVSELRNNDVTGTEPNHLGVLYYDEIMKCIAISPSNEGSGVIRVTDTRSNDSYDIVFTVTEAGEGINVFDDNDMFSFYNSDARGDDGKYNDPYDPDKLDQKWTFVTGVSDWNPDMDNQGDGEPDPEIMPPYLNNLASGQKGALFTFNTLAVSTTLFFRGKILVDSTYPGFTPKTLSSRGGNSDAEAQTVDFAPDIQAPSAITHTVTVTVQSTDAQFDRYTERYGAAITPKPYEDASAPHLYWNRSFPQIATLQDGIDSVELRLTIFDDSGLSNLTATNFEAEEMELTEVSPAYWYLDWVVTQNGSYSFSVMDYSGNITQQTVNVGWFAKDAGSDIDVPSLTADIEVDEEPWEFGQIVPAGQLSAVRLVYDLAGNDDQEDISVKAEHGRYLFTEAGEEGSPAKVTDFIFEEIDAGDDSAFKITANGLYRITATKGSYQRSIYFLFNGVDSAVPEISLSLGTDANGDAALYYSAHKITLDLFAAGRESADANISPIDSLMINDIRLELPGGESISIKGYWKPESGLYNGEYTLSASDKAGNKPVPETESLKIDNIPVAVQEGCLSVESDWTQAGGKGWISVDAAKISGGYYDSQHLVTSKEYRGSYAYTLVAAADAFQIKDTTGFSENERDIYEAARKAYFDDQTFTPLSGIVKHENLAAGEYVLYLKDLLEEKPYEKIIALPLTVLSEAINFKLETTNTFAQDGSFKVSATGGLGGFGTYQFSLQKLTGGNPLTADDASWQWRYSDDWSALFDTATFDDLEPGNYQVAVRTMHGVTQKDLTDHVVKQEVYSDAESVQLAAQEAVDDLQQAMGDLSVAKVAYEAEPADEELEDTYFACLIDLQSLCQKALMFEDSKPVDLEDQYTAALRILNEQLESAKTKLNTALSDLQTDQTRIENLVNGAYGQNPEWYQNALVKTAKVAKLFTVTFDADGGTRTDGGELVQTVVEGQGAVAPVVSRDRYRFLGWDLNFDVVTSDLVVTAKWERIPSYIPPNTNTGTPTPGAGGADETGSDKPAEEVTPPIEEAPPTPTEEPKGEQTPPEDAKEIDTQSEIGGNTVTTAVDQPPQQGEDGTWLLPEGATITTPEGQTITVPPQARLSADGQTLILPRGFVGATIVDSEGNERYVEPGMQIKLGDSADGSTDTQVLWQNPFSDLSENEWYFDDVSFAYRYGLLSGVSGTEFAPHLTVSRAMLVAVLHRLAGSPAAEGSTNPFSDVSGDAWYSEAVRWAAENGITSGYGDGLFGSEDAVSRQDLAALLCRIADYLGLELPAIREYENFDDQDEVADYARSSLQRLYCAGIIGGKPGNLLDPRGEATRAELAAMLHRFLLASGLLG